MAFKEIKAEELNGNAFSMIGKQWMLVTGGDKSGFNTMTASWGGVGIMWSKPVVTAYIRPTRHTYGYLENNDVFTVSFYGEEYRKQLQICGTKSGRDTDKVAECGFTPAFTPAGAVYFEEAEVVFECRKLYYDDIKPENFLTPEIDKWYDNDYHRMYIAEITRVLVKE